ncbi:MAG: trigger factor family protein [Candidatus Kapabacteria bacterium]|nr:trigger factor family protein [Candidatus Kapabacteria bacterium]
MEYKINSIEDTVQEIEFIITNDELTPAYNQALLKLQPKVALAGFRKGKVPMPMVKNMYGESVKYEAQQDMVNVKFREVINEKKVGVIGLV